MARLKLDPSLAIYLDAFERGYLDPDECVAHWEAAHAHAWETFMRFVVFVGRRDLSPDEEACLEQLKLHLADNNQQRVTAHQRRAVWQEHNVRRPPRGLAVCPLCGNEAIVRPRCPLCGGLGFVGREQRNRYKRGLRP